jgi:hypothetical protein
VVSLQQHIYSCAMFDLVHNRNCNIQDEFTSYELRAAKLVFDKSHYLVGRHLFPEGRCQEPRNHGDLL